MLPPEPFDNQRLVDAFQILWVFNQSQNCWISQGKIKTLPIANATTTGLLQSKLKYLMDTIPDKGGGYAIITKPLNRRTIDNPDGIIFGKVELVSNSLTINCIDANNNIINTSKKCQSNYLETDKTPPGFDLNLSSDFLNSLCIDVPGGPGPRGLPGNKGSQGKDGTGDGPQGEPGDSGKDATQTWPITGVQIVDIDDMTDIAIVKLDIDQANGILHATKSKINISSDATTPVQQFIIKRLNKGITWGDCLEYTLNPPAPCKPGETSQDIITAIDPTIAFYPEYFQPTDLPGTTYEPVAAKFSDILNQIIGFYNGKLDDAAAQWDQQIADYLRTLDTQARQQLDATAQKLETCAGIPTLDLCVGINEDCASNLNNNPAASGGSGQGTQKSPTGQVDYYGLSPIPEILGLDPTKSQVVSLGMAEATAYNPVFSFKAVDALQFPRLANGTLEDKACDNLGGCWVQYQNGVAVFIPYTIFIPKGSVICTLPQSIAKACDEIPPHLQTQIIPDPNDPIQQAILAELQSQADATATTPEERQVIEQEMLNVQRGHPSNEILANIYQTWIDNLAQNLNAATILYKKDRLRYSPELVEFPAGIYVFLYRDGAVSQVPLNNKERYGISADDKRFISGPFVSYYVGNEGNGKVLEPFTIINPYDRTDKATINAPIASTEVGLEIGWAPTSYVDLITFDYFNNHIFDAADIQGNNGVHFPLPYVDYIGTSPQILEMENMINWQKMPAVGVSNDIIKLRQAYYEKPLGGRAVSFDTNAPGYFFTRIKSAYSATNIFGELVMPTSNNKYSNDVALIHMKERHLKVPAINARPIATGSIKLQVVRVITTDTHSSTFGLGASQ
jgi:hypothetical protein